MDNKPMVIHMKKKPKIRVKVSAEKKLNEQNELTVRRSVKAIRCSKAVKASAYKRRNQITVIKQPDNVQTIIQQNSRIKPEKVLPGKKQESKNQSVDVKIRTASKEAGGQHEEKEERPYKKHQRLMKEQGAVMNKRNSTVHAVGAVGAKAAVNQMDGGDELHDSYMVMDTSVKPIIITINAGKKQYKNAAQNEEHYHSKIEKTKKIKKISALKKIGIKTVQKSGMDTMGQEAKEAPKKVLNNTVRSAIKKSTREIKKPSVKVSVQAAGTTLETMAAGAGNILTGKSGREAASRKIGKIDKLNKSSKAKSTRNRMIQLFINKLRQEDNQDSAAKVLKDIVMMRLSIVIKKAASYIGLFLGGLSALTALAALPIIGVIAVIYNSPFAIFLPSISSSETTQEVLSAYTADFYRDVYEEAGDYDGYDGSEVIYVGYEEEGTPDNYRDIITVYMVRYGMGDTATDMTDSAKSNLKKVFEDMCGYSISSGTEEGLNEDGEEVIYQIKYVDISLKTYQDMIVPYGFSEEEAGLLHEIMNTEYQFIVHLKSFKNDIIYIRNNDGYHYS